MLAPLPRRGRERRPGRRRGARPRGHDDHRRVPGGRHRLSGVRPPGAAPPGPRPPVAPARLLRAAGPDDAAVASSAPEDPVGEARGRRGWASRATWTTTARGSRRGQHDRDLGGDVQVLPPAQPGGGRSAGRRAHPVEDTPGRRRGPPRACLVSRACRARRHPSGTSFAEWMGTLADLAGTAALLGWDRETLMPPGRAPRGAPARWARSPRCTTARSCARTSGEALAALAGDRAASTTTPAAMVRLAHARPRPGRCASPRRWCARSARPARAASAPGPTARARRRLRRLRRPARPGGAR